MTRFRHGMTAVSFFCPVLTVVSFGLIGLADQASGAWPSSVADRAVHAPYTVLVADPTEVDRSTVEALLIELEGAVENIGLARDKAQARADALLVKASEASSVSDAERYQLLYVETIGRVSELDAIEDQIRTQMQALQTALGDLDAGGVEK